MEPHSIHFTDTPFHDIEPNSFILLLPTQFHEMKPNFSWFINIQFHETWANFSWFINT
jgi:hypothetical protein